jgi:virulence factor Mce-like protein
MRRRRSGLSPFTVGAIALVVICIGTYLGFAKDLPFGSKFQIDAVFPSANSIRANSPVRIAGVNVGKVKSVKPQAGSDAARITIELNESALPIHADATAKIRPRIFLEGNFFIDLKPGTPGAPVLGRDDTIKVTQTSTPVQLDEVLTALQDDTRADLQEVLDEFSGALNDKPTAAQDADADRSARGQTAAESLNDAAEDGAAALRSTSLVNQALLGIEPEEDIQRMLRGLAATSEGLGRNETQLQDLISNLNTTMAAFASEETALRTTIRELGPTLATANTTFGKLNAAFPSVRAFSREIIPGVRETPATIEASFPWIEQTRRLLGQNELRGLARELSPATRDLAVFVAEGEKLFPQIELVSRCASDVVLPTGDMVIRDEFESGAENYKEFMYSMVGLSGEGQNFDANGQYVRFQPGGGSNAVSLGEQGSGGLFGNAFPGVATRPKMPARKPPYNADTDCYKSTKPDVNGPWAAKGEFSRSAQQQTRQLSGTFGGKASK